VTGSSDVLVRATESPRPPVALRSRSKVKDETRATDPQTFTIEILPPEAPTITEALSSGTVGEF
jgi:hypothetical protein